jgi:Rad3-related DNA helicase
VGTVISAEAIWKDVLASFDHVLALSGSMPSDPVVQNILSPGAGAFQRIDLTSEFSAPVFVCPVLDFSYPLSMKDLTAARRYLRKIRRALGPSVLVFGQNRESNDVLAMQMRVRNQIAVLDTDIGSDWESLRSMQPDFLFASLGGSLSESVNMPQNVFSCVVILAAGYNPSDLYSQLRSENRKSRQHDQDTNDSVDAVKHADAVSRIIQAVGRVQRDLHSLKPAFLLDKRFAEPRFMRAWPEGWQCVSNHAVVPTGFDEILHHARESIHPL